MAATREDVAKKAGVSVATVSYVFTKGRYVSEKLTEKVVEAAKELNYYPDFVARSMVMKRTNTIGVLTSDIASPLQMEVIRGIQESAIEKNYFVTISGGTKKLESYLENFISRKVDGVFISVMAQELKDDYIKKLLDFGIKVIITSTREINDDRICGLELDMNDGMQKIISYLAELNHTNIAYLSGFDEQYTADRRLKHFKRYMDSMLGNKNPTIIMGGLPYDTTIESGYELAKKLIASKKEFTAVVCTNDLMAFGAIKAFTDNGYNVPRDVSVASFDDIQFAKCFTPALTTYSHGGMDYGKRIFDILYRNIQEDTVLREKYTSKLIIRESCTKNIR